MKRAGSMTVAGMMSGTSADGIDVALVRIRPDHSGIKLRLLLHCAYPFSAALRRAVLAAMDAETTTTRELARLNWRLGVAYSEALRATINQYTSSHSASGHYARDGHAKPIDLVGCHGQTIYHQAARAAYSGRSVACTWQIGEMALLAAEAGVPVVSNFRPADMVAGGQGAPLVPLLDYTFFRHARRGRVLQNIGGIGNLTAIPPGAAPDQILAFDTGPGNMVIDAAMQSLYRKPYDRGGKIASTGMVISAVLEPILARGYFIAPPPKTAGREQFGTKFVETFLKTCSNFSKQPADAIATATALTAASIARAYERFVQATMGAAPVDYVLSGGGVYNAALMAMLGERLRPLGCTLKTSDDFNLPAQAKEAVAFALLAYQTWHHRPGNLPAATGAGRPAILGEITPAQIGSQTKWSE